MLASSAPFLTGHPKFDPDLVFQHRLARELGMTVAEMGERMSLREYVRWIAFHKAEDREHEKERKRIARQGARRPRRR